MNHSCHGDRHDPFLSHTHTCRSAPPHFFSWLPWRSVMSSLWSLSSLIKSAAPGETPPAHFLLSESAGHPIISLPRLHDRGVSRCKQVCVTASHHVSHQGDLWPLTCVAAVADHLLPGGETVSPQPACRSGLYGNHNNNNNVHILWPSLSPAPLRLRPSALTGGGWAAAGTISCGGLTCRFINQFIDY